MNISGVIVYAAPNQAESVEKSLNAIEGVEVHAAENGKLVVTVEHENINALADQVVKFQDMSGVMSVAMVYQHNEDLETLNGEEVSVEETSQCTDNTCSDYTLEEAQL